MYDTFPQFLAGINEGLDLPVGVIRAQDCWRVYCNARENTGDDFLVMGRGFNIANAGGAAGLGTTDETRAGSVLNSQNWSVNLNDSWTLGGIHGHREFHIAYDGNDATFRAQSIVTENADRPLFVTGRELIGITYFGYSEAEGHDSARFGKIFMCTHPEQANAATFQAYRAQVAGIEAALV